MNGEQLELLLEVDGEYYLPERPERLWGCGVASVRRSCLWRNVELVDVALVGVL